jgi:uncharacterized protein (TIGR00297 family)
MQLMGMHLATIVLGPWAATPARFGFVLAVTVAFAGVGYLVHGVTRSGALAGGVICFALFACAGPGAFVALFAVFAVTWVATRMGKGRKQKLGTAERGEGRTASQVLANLGVAALCAAWFALAGDLILLLAMAAALTEAAADTVSSECGQAFRASARLITTFERVPAGTDGGITLMGTAAGAVAAALVSAVCALIALPRGWLWIPALSGVLGMLADSYLGAWLERAGRVGNDAVNFISTAVAAAIAISVLRVLH